MPLNPDQVRVDLLRIKRKLYISYPEGSKERREFLLASKLSELNYLQKLIAPDLIDLVFEEYAKQQKAEAMNAALGVFAGFSFSVMLYGFYTLYPHNQWLLIFPAPAFVGFLHAATHVFHAIKHWKSLQPFKKEYEKIAKKVEKILKEIHDLAKNEPPRIP